jgi:peptidoglycan/LPS O-acetylase OafA/YrhL
MHLSYLDSLRALAALYVMMSHISQTVWPITVGNLHGVSLALTAPFRYGRYAVGLFIVLSGFSLMLPVIKNGGYLKGGSKKFFAKRARRILPPYYFALILSLILALTVLSKKTGTHWDVAIPVTYLGVWTHIAMLQDVFSPSQINHVFWSISVEWRIYFLFPVIVLSMRLWGRTRTVLLTMAFSIALFFLVRNSIWFGITPSYFALFTFGMCAAQIAYGKAEADADARKKIPWSAFAVVLFLVFCVLVYAHRRNVTPTQEFCLDTVDGVVSTCVLVAVGISDNLLRRILSWKPLAFIGTFAYSIYLVHALIVQLVWQFVLTPFHANAMVCYLMLIAVGAPAAVAISYLFHLAFERPFMNFTRAGIPAPPVSAVQT